MSGLIAGLQAIDGVKTPIGASLDQVATDLQDAAGTRIVVLVTDGEETCGGAPCDLGKTLHANARQLTVHIIGYRPWGYSWTGEQSVVDARCLADQNGGLYISASTEDDLVAALEKTLDCPMTTQLIR